jgi:hypothetical protein
MRVASGSQPQNYRESSRYGCSTGGGCFEVGFASAAFAGELLLFGAGAFPTVRYLRIFSTRFCPRPRIASKSSTLLNVPFDLRICKIFSAITDPIPGTVWSTSEEAVLMLTGFSGGFFSAKLSSEKQKKIRPRKRRMRGGRRSPRHDGNIMQRLYP